MGLGSCWTQDPPALLLFPQTQILREVALDLGSRGGVQGSLSSTPASRVRSRQVVLTLMTPEGTTESGQCL